MDLHRLLVEDLDIPLFNGERVPRALSETGPEAVTVALLDDHRLAVTNLARALGSGDNAVAATVALLFIYLDYFPNCRHRSSPIHTRDDVHHSTQDGSLSLYTIEPH